MTVIAHLPAGGRLPVRLPPVSAFAHDPGDTGCQRQVFPDAEVNQSAAQLVKLTRNTNQTLNCISVFFSFRWRQKYLLSLTSAVRALSRYKTARILLRCDRYARQLYLEVT